MINNANIDLPYSKFSLAQKQLHNIEAIDYFFAKEFSELFICYSMNPSCEDAKSTDIIFHLLIALSISLRDGHSCLPLKSIAKQRIGFMCDSEGIVSHQGFHFPSLNELESVCDQLTILETDEQAVVFHQQRLYMRRYYLFEQQIIRFVQNQNTHYSLNNDVEEIKDCLSVLFPNDCRSPNSGIDWQKVAVANALNKSFSIIAGGPGTGKTYTVTKLLAALIMLNKSEPLQIALVAPTGKAAQRLSESINQAKVGFTTLLSEQTLQQIPTEAQTIHRLLGVIPNNANFKHDKENPLSVDVVLIDEASMVDLPLMARIFRALPTGCKVILLGDAQQLPSVAAGSVLADFTPLEVAQYSKQNSAFLTQVTQIDHLPINKKAALDHLTYLTESRRFDGKGGIGRISQAVINGDSEGSWQLLQKAKDKLVPQLMLTEDQDIDWLQSLVKAYYLPLMQSKSIEAAFDLLTKFRILSATRKGEKGVEQINTWVESLLNNGRNNSYKSDALYHGKPIMINENDYSLGLYNGDIGLIWADDHGHLMAIFQQQDHNLKRVLPSRLPQFESVYAMTIHKTQGSEFEHVAMILPSNADNQLLTRELLYTGMTRAKKQLTINAKKPVWHQGVESKVSRYSGIEFI